MGDSFTHLHLHTEFSMLDGAARVKEVVAAAAADGQPAIGITDHGNMYGILDFYKACRDQGITPVLGTEAYMAGETRFERPPRRGKIDDTGGDTDGGHKLYYHLTLLAENDAGYRNLIKLSSQAFLDGYYYKPRCLLPGQEIVTRTGVKAIEDVVVGDEVLTHRGRFRKVTRTMSREHVGDIYGLRLAGRYERVTWMTGEHPVLLREGSGERRWVEAKDLVAGRPTPGERATNWTSWVCLPKVASDADIVDAVRTADHVTWAPVAGSPGRFRRVTPRTANGPTLDDAELPDEIPLDHDFGYFLGLYVAQGWASDDEVAWAFHRDQQVLADHCVVMAEKLTGQPVAVDARPGRPGDAGVTVGCFSTLLAQLLRSLCGTGARDKHLPEFVFEAPREFQQGLVDGVLDGDGSVKPDTTTLTQASKGLAWQVRMLRAGLSDDFACVTAVEPPAERHATQLRSCSSLRRPTGHRHTQADDDYVYKPVAEVLTRRYRGTVHNIEVEDDHSYVSDFAIHNCDWELLDRYAEGVVATTGCLGGHVLQALLQGDEKGATEKAARLQDIFGRDNLFVELQDHGLAAQKQTNPKLIEIAKRIGAPLLATNDSHYTHQADHVAHDALLCVQTGALRDDPNRFKFESDQHYLKTAAEMRHLFRDYPEACDNTLWIAERADVAIEFGKPKLPTFPLPEGFTSADDYLRHLAVEGAKERYGQTLPTEVVDRIAYELGVISQMGFSDYFLIVWDLIRFARERRIRVGPGRGSAAGCCVAYCLRIVDLDPIKYDLLFERFLNPGRLQMPDIDMDFDDRYRGDMIKYATERYGWDHVAQIITFSTIKARAAVRDAARVLGYPYVVGDKIAKAMPPLVMGRDTPLYACFEPTPKFEDGYKAAGELRDMYATDPDAKAVIDVARGLEGLRRQDSIHAAAVVITDAPLTEYLPIQRKPAPGGAGATGEPGGELDSAPIVTQYEMHGVEELGLLKMDFLGLRNLSVIEQALDLIEESTGVRPDIDNIPLDDDAALDLLRRGDSIGVFQLEGGPMRALMRSLAPTSFDDVAALVALYRPGPMAANMHNDYADRKNGRKPITYLHPDLEEILGDTYGLMIYQEAVMRVAQKFAGYSLEEADNLRKACGKKIRELIAKEREKFVAGCEATGYGHEIGTKLFDIIEPFADYAFNKSHSYGYGFVAYQTAWLKAHHPVEYLAALLTSVKSNLDKAAVYLNECRQMGIQVLVPDVNVSHSDFIARGQTIPFGLSAVRNVGEGLVGLIIEEREKNGPFADFYEFCERVDTNVLNKRTIESLIKAGGFDSMGHPRRGLLEVFEQIVDQTCARRRERDMGVMTLFGEATDDGGRAFDERPKIRDVEFDKRQRLAFEKEMLGLYVSDHPLMGAEAALRRRTDCTITDLREAEGEGVMKTVGGVVTALQRKYTKKGDLMAVFMLEDLQSAIEVMVFPKTMQDHGYKLAEDRVVCIKGRLDAREDLPKIIAMEIEPFEPVADGAPPVRINLPGVGLSERVIADLRRVLKDHPGESQVFLHLGERKVLRLPDDFCVDAGNGLVGELREMLGAGAVLV